MEITVEELNKIRRRTLDNAKKMISSRGSSNASSVKKAADIIKVTSEKPSTNLKKNH